jgi:hypothetical protein
LWSPDVEELGSNNFDQTSMGHRVPLCTVMVLYPDELTISTGISPGQE